MENEFETTRISLNVNHRSTKNIVDLTDSFIKYQRSEYSKKELKARNQEYGNPSFIVETDMPKQKKLKKINRKALSKFMKRLGINFSNKDKEDLVQMSIQYNLGTVVAAIKTLEDKTPDDLGAYLRTVIRKNFTSFIENPLISLSFNSSKSTLPSLISFIILSRDSITLSS